MSAAPALSVRHLAKRYGRVEAVRDLSFDVQPGEVFGLMGPNGAGKTTTVECVIGLRDPDDGDIRVAGIDRRDDPLAIKARIGAALQSTALPDAMTPREALTVFGSLYPTHRPAAALLERFGLAEKANARFGTLSGGQRQRLALALAFVNEPDIVLLDEPTAGLDPQARRELHGEIAGLKADGHTVLLTTHYAEEAESLCDRVAIIDRGRLVGLGTPDALIAASTRPPTVVVSTRQPLEAAAFARMSGLSDVRIDGTRATFRADDIPRTLADLAQLLGASGTELTALHVEKAALEDVFIELTHPAQDC